MELEHAVHAVTVTAVTHAVSSVAHAVHGVAHVGVGESVVDPEEMMSEMKHDEE